MKQRFDDVHHAARELAEIVVRNEVVVRNELATDIVLALGEQARPIAQEVAARLDCASDVVAIQRGDEPGVDAVPQCAGLRVVVVDRGVETGRLAMAAAGVLQKAGVTSLVLAVPVCPRQAESVLARAYDDIIAIHRPLGRRSLQWHYSSPLE